MNIAVRDLAEFVYRTGNLGGSGGFAARDRALEGVRAHQKLQKNRPAGYVKEYFLSRTIQRNGREIKICGRIDGLLRQDQRVLIEEIKTIQSGDPPVQAEPWHLAQARLYAALFHYASPEDSEFDLRVTYLVITSDEIATFNERTNATEVCAFFEEGLGRYLDWLDRYLDWVKARDASIQALQFPYEKYRPGQRDLAVAAFRALRQQRQLFAEAPTGLGKTISILFPAIKFLPESGARLIFYLTAKTLGRTVAEKALNDLRNAGLKLRSISLTARDKICFNEGKPCDLRTCPFAAGYYDRIKPALAEALEVQELNKDWIEQVARRHRVCPAELSLDASLWVDAVVGDYNYAFDPQASLRRFFGEERADVLLLVDEAHNLLERARAMFSARLYGPALQRARMQIHRALPRCSRALSAMLTEMLKLEGIATREPGSVLVQAMPEKLMAAANRFLKGAEQWLVRNEPAPFSADLMDLFFEVNSFLLTAAEMGDEYVIIAEQPEPESRSLHLFCIDPAKRLGTQLEKVRGTIFFSATLSPLSFFRDSLGGGKEAMLLGLNSPFPPENLQVIINRRISTTYQNRAATSGQVARAILDFVSGDPGNTLVFFPSYKYLENILEAFNQLAPVMQILKQEAGMAESARADFLQRFIEQHEKVVGFALMGGFFGEGIDLGGLALSNVVIVGVGMPQLSPERECIRQYFEARNGCGFEYAYVFPGMNRVIQAVGRLIRSETDRGRALLIDSRFGERRYRELFPRHWKLD